MGWEGCLGTPIPWKYRSCNQGSSNTMLPPLQGVEYNDPDCDLRLIKCLWQILPEVEEWLYRVLFIFLFCRYLQPTTTKLAGSWTRLIFDLTRSSHIYVLASLSRRTLPVITKYLKDVKHHGSGFVQSLTQIAQHETQLESRETVNLENPWSYVLGSKLMFNITI